MSRLKMTTAGESHGPGITCLVEGLPAGLHISKNFLEAQLARRQQGYGRGGRMALEQDTAEVLAGLRGERTLGTPVVLFIKNRDYENWREVVGPEANPEGEASRAFTVPRPGHGDLAGALKCHFDDLRDVLERTSARETAGRVAAGALAKALLAEFGISIGSFVTRIGPVEATFCEEDLGTLFELAETGSTRCPSPEKTLEMEKAIDAAKEGGDSLGGQFVVAALGVPPGLGSYASWEGRLDGRLAGALMSVQATKAVEIGAGIDFGGLPGSEAHDPIGLESVGEGWRITRASNNAGGLEAGLSNGQPVVARCTMKAIPTLMKPLPSVDLRTKETSAAHSERSDVCAVPAAAVVAEAMMALVLADALLEKYGGDSLSEIRERHEAYLAACARLDWF